VLIAVTGAGGFVGGRLTAELARRGHNVIAYSRRPGPSPALCAERVTYRTWDLSRGPIAPPPGVGAVVHCAARVSDWGADNAFLKANVDGTRAVLETFRGPARFVYVSSASVYDPSRPKRMVTEDTPDAIHYLNAYARTKMLAECVVRDSGRPALILRPHVVYGPGDRTLLPRLLAARRFGRLIAVGDGHNVLSVTHVDNLVQAILCSIEGDCNAGTFNVADSEMATLDELLRTLLERLGLPPRIAYIPTWIATPLAALLECSYRLAGASRAPLLTRYIVCQLANDYTLDISRAQRILGYAPTFTFRDGPLADAGPA
jgi:nucleoside-diphosphate-sugar epimerase